MSSSRTRSRRPVVLIISAIVSAILLAVFLFLKHLDSYALDLEVNWLIVSAIPIFLGLLIGGYIRKFKGLGIELEISLQNPLGRTQMLAADVAEDLPGDMKASQGYLSNLSEEDRRRIQRLSFIIERTDYYGAYVVERYLNDLPNVEFIEIRDTKGRFLYLLPVRVFGYRNEFNFEKIQQFIESIEKDKVKEAFPADVITETIDEDESLIESLERLRRSHLGLLPLVSKGGQLLGIVNREAVERRIADEVIAAQKRA